MDSGIILKPVSAAVWREPVLKSKNLFSAVISSCPKFKGLASQWLKKAGPRADSQTHGDTADLPTSEPYRFIGSKVSGDFYKMRHSMCPSEQR